MAEGLQSEIFTKVREFVKKSFNDEAQMLHFDRTVYWLKQLKPDADEALLISAVAHDLERASRLGEEGLGRTEKGFLDKADNQYHQEKGAEILGNFLKENGADEKLIERVKHLVSKHEVGGDEDQNLIRDVDSLSFVENNTHIFLSRFNALGYDKIKEKFDWMYNRITDPKVKEIAKPFYEKMIKELKEKVKETESHGA